MLDTVILKQTKYGVPAGTKGATVDISSDGTAFTVEFVDENYDTYEEALFHYFSAEELQLVERNR